MPQYSDYKDRKKKRKTKRAAIRFMVVLGAALAMLGVAAGVTFIIQKVGGVIPTPPPAPVQSQLDAPLAESVPDDSMWNFVGPVKQTIDQMAIIAPDYRMIALPANGRVDMSYFDTATFVGDSLTQGLQLYKQQGIPNAHYCAYRGIGPKQIYDGSIQRREDGGEEIPMDALRDSAPKNIYLLLGANPMVSTDDETIVAYYREMIQHMKTHLDPSIGYYIQSLTPVRPDNTPGFEMERIQNLNNLLAKMAREESVYFIDLTEPLAGDDGFLREEYASSDGYHLSPDGYSVWVEYLVTHTAYSPENPYLEA